MLLELAGKLGSIGGAHRHEILDTHGIQKLAAETLGRDARADSLARRIDGGGGRSRSAADDQCVEWRPGVEFFLLSIDRAAVQLGDDFLERHSPLREGRAVQEDRGYRHHRVPRDLVLEQRAVDHRVANARVEHGHQVQGLHDVGTVLATERNVGLEGVIAVEGGHPAHQRGVDLRRVAPDLQQREHQRCELMAQRHAGET